MTDCQPPAELGNTQDSSVMPSVRSRLSASGMVTQVLLPLNDRAPPNRPAPDQVGPSSTPSLPKPEASAAWDPAPSLKPRASTRSVEVTTKSLAVYSEDPPFWSVMRPRMTLTPAVCSNDAGT